MGVGQRDHLQARGVFEQPVGEDVVDVPHATRAAIAAAAAAAELSVAADRVVAARKLVLSSGRTRETSDALASEELSLSPHGRLGTALAALAVLADRPFARRPMPVVGPVVRVADADGFLSGVMGS